MPRATVLRTEANSRVLNSLTLSDNGQVLAKSTSDRVLSSVLLSTDTNSKASLTQRYYPESLGAIATDRAGVWIVGASGSGKLYRSADGGMTWRRVKDTEKSQIHSIAYGGSGSTWVALARSSTTFYLYRSTDSGVTWSLVHTSAGATGGGQVCGDSSLFWATAGAKILKSTDGGATWVTVYTAASGNVNTVAIRPASDTLVALGDSGRVYWSDDGGSTWTHSATLAGTGVAAVGVDGAAWCCTFVNAGVSRIYRSTDDGFTWGAAVYTGSSGDFINGMTANNANVWLACTETGKILRSTNNGATWAVAYTVPTVAGSSVDLAAITCDWANTVIAAAANGLHRSVDNGVDWAAGVGSWVAFLGAYDPLLVATATILRLDHALDLHVTESTAVTLIGA
jgi:photosystem II stability/assembly factor-like uncharacterized protein